MLSLLSMTLDRNAVPIEILNSSVLSRWFVPINLLDNNKSELSVIVNINNFSKKMIELNKVR